MRTAIFIGLLVVASAINKECLKDESVVVFIAILAGLMMVVDVVEFVKKLLK